jgi:DNA-binding CsgD family transcriptional regulator
MGYPPTEPHPINDEVVDRAFHEHSRKAGELDDIDAVHDALDQVQEIFLKRLGDLHREAVLGSQRITKWGYTQREIPDKYLLIGSFERLWRRVFDSISLTEYSDQRIVRESHKWQAETYDLKSEEDAIVIATPISWTKGRNAARTEIRGLLEQGLTPAEAVDLWFTEYEPSSVNQSLQADYRGVSQQTVNQNIRKAKEKLESQRTQYLPALHPYDG